MAIGSRVPAWPTLRVPASRRTRATTSWEVIPAGLSTTTSPGSVILGWVVVVGASSSVGTSRGFLYGSSSPAYAEPRCAATASSSSRALASTSSRWRAVSGSASATNSRDGACRMPSCLATSDRIMPLADSSAAPVAASAASSVCSPTAPASTV